MKQPTPSLPPVPPVARAVHADSARPARATSGVSRAGVSLAYVTIVLTALIALCSFAVDLGRVRLAKGELQTAADAAARHAAAGIAAGETRNAVIDRAVAAAADNHADGSATRLLRSDVEYPNQRSPHEERVAEHRGQKPAAQDF